MGGLFFVSAEFGGGLGPLFIGLIQDATQNSDLALIGLAAVSLTLGWLIYPSIANTEL